MKSYLSLVPISAKVRKRQNRMTILCVIISIFLVTAIFSVADMMIRTQSDRMTGKNGSWHIELDGISQETALKIAERDDVVSIGAVTIFNPDGELPYRMDGKRVVLYGIDESYLTMNSTGAAEGRFPQGMAKSCSAAMQRVSFKLQLGTLLHYVRRPETGILQCPVWAVWRKATIPGNIL